MNNTNNTEELLKTIDLTLEDVYRIIMEGVKSRYKSFGALREITTPDDMTQEVLVYYLSIMKSTGDIRLNYYIKKFQDRQHIVNLIKQTAYQLPLYTLKSKYAVNKPLSLQIPYCFDFNNTETMTTLEDIIPDAYAEQDIYTNVTDKELNELLREELNRLNICRLKQTYNVNSYDECNLPFLLDTSNYVKATEKTIIQLQIIKDLCDGCSKSSLTKKYKTFKEDLEIIRYAFLGKLHEYLRTQ